MKKDTALREKRAELQRQIDAGKYKSLADIALDGTGFLIQKLTRNPEPISFWYSAIVIVLVTLLISEITSLLLGENARTMPHVFRSEVLPLNWSLVVLATANVIAVKIYIGIIFTTLRDNLVKAIESVADLADLQRWIAAINNIKKSLFFSLTYGILVGLYSSILVSVISGGFIGFGVTLRTVIMNFQFGMAVYYLFIFLATPIRFSRYQYKLYASNPSSSEVIELLSDMLSKFVYIGAVLGASLTLILSLLRLFTPGLIIILVLFVWAPLIIAFIINQYALAKIIARAKKEKLYEIQVKIEMLETQEDIPGVKILEHVRALIDYHDYIRATPNSALSLRSGLELANALLLPLLIPVLTNLDNLLAILY